MRSPNFLLVVQAIHTSWTKNSRGGPLAAPRNRVPEIFDLPFRRPPPNPLTPIYVRHDISWGESNQFNQPLTEQIEVAEFTGDLKNRLLGLHAVGDGSIRVTFEGSYSHNSGRKVLIDYTRMGAPVRTVPLEIFSLRPGEWGQVRYNGRFSWNSGWKYEKWVYNIGLFMDAIPAKCFDSSPARSYSNMADLW